MNTLTLAITLQVRKVQLAIANRSLNAAAKRYSRASSLFTYGVGYDYSTVQAAGDEMQAAQDAVYAATDRLTNASLEYRFR